MVFRINIIYFYFFKETLDAVNPYFKSMSEEQQKQFSNDQMSKIFELQGNELLDLPYRVIYFVVKKVKNRDF